MQYHFFICFNGCSAAFALSLHLYHCILLLPYLAIESYFMVNMTIFDSMLILSITLIMFVFRRSDRSCWKL